jgi:virulence-associated protein VapD
MAHLNKRIEDLNNAYMDIRQALKVIKIHVKQGEDSDTHFYRIEKAIEALHKLILKDLKNEVIEEEFDKIIKKFKR